mgnify:CR=1 FL=1|jgi:hypothetical protein
MILNKGRINFLPFFYVIILNIYYYIYLSTKTKDMNKPLTKGLIEAIDLIDPNLEITEFALSISFILNKYYSSTNKKQFLQTLTKTV